MARENQSLKPPQEANFNGVTPRETERWMALMSRYVNFLTKPAIERIILPDVNRRGGTIGISSNGATVWPTANLAMLTPFEVVGPSTELVGMVVSVGGVGGNFDIGIYNYAGTRLVSEGGSAYTLNTNHTFTFSSTLILPRGLYYAAGVSDGVAIKVFQDTTFSSYAMAGLKTAINSYPLPATITFDAQPAQGCFCVALIPRVN